jgi:hypothetical protein
MVKRIAGKNQKQIERYVENSAAERFPPSSFGE